VKITYHQAVRQEVNDACAWYDERKDDLGNEFFQELERVLESIRVNPQSFSLASFGRRKAHLKRFPYTISYRASQDQVRILSVHHDKRHPTYAVRRK
jgi:plasmid stabilization system protein ParE